MSLDRMPDDLAERTARLVNVIEDQLAAAQDDKKQVYADLREELKSLGMGGAEISKEVAAFKAAIAETRRTNEQRIAAGEKADRADELASIIRASRARARVKQTEPQVAPQPAQSRTDAPLSAPPADEHLSGLPSTGQGGDESPVNNSPETATVSPRKAAEAEGESPALRVGATIAPAEAGIDGQPSLTPAATDRTVGANVSGAGSAGVTAGRDRQPSIVQFHQEETPEQRIKRLRPHCRNVTGCAGVGTQC